MALFDWQTVWMDVFNDQNHYFYVQLIIYKTFHPHDKDSKLIKKRFLTMSFFRLRAKLAIAPKNSQAYINLWVKEILQNCFHLKHECNSLSILAYLVCQDSFWVLIGKSIALKDQKQISCNQINVVLSFNYKSSPTSDLKESRQNNQIEYSELLDRVNFPNAYM